METIKMIKELRNLEEKHRNDRVDTFGTNWRHVCHDVANWLEELNNQLNNINNLLIRDLFDITYHEYKKRGNSINGAQLQMIERQNMLCSHNIGYEKTKYMILNDFDTYHSASKTEIENYKGGCNLNGKE